MKKLLIPTILFLLLLLAFPSLCVSGAKSGLLLWFNTMIPTLFPFILATNLIRDLGGFPYFERLAAPLFTRLFAVSRGGSYPVLMGFLCGYPMGAKAVCDSFAAGRIDRSEADYLLTFTNNPSPIYMISYVALFTLDRTYPAAAIIVITSLSSVITAWIYRKVYRFRRNFSQVPGSPPATLSSTNTDSMIDRHILDACDLLVRVGGYMILFSILSACLSAITVLPPAITCTIGGLLEQTTGLALLKAATFSESHKFILALIFICFGGLSISAQTYSVIHQHGLSLPGYIIFKILGALIAGGLAAVYAF